MAQRRGVPPSTKTRIKTAPAMPDATAVMLAEINRSRPMYRTTDRYIPCHQARPTDTSAVASMIGACEKAYGPSAISQSAARTHRLKPIKSTVNAVKDLAARGNPIRIPRVELTACLALSFTTSRSIKTCCAFDASCANLRCLNLGLIYYIDLATPR